MSNAVTFILLGLVVTVFAVISIRLSKGPTRTVNQLDGPILDLLNRGYDGGILYIDHQGSKRFLQLVKYIRSKGDYGIQLEFPNASWSEGYYSLLRECLVRNAISFIESPQDLDEGLCFLSIDFEKSVETAHDVVRMIITEVFGLDSNSKFGVRLENASPHDIVVDEQPAERTI